MVTINTSTKNTIPVPGSSFDDNNQTFHAEEDAERFGEIFGSLISTGGTHVSGAGLTHSPTATVAYSVGFYVSESGSITYADDETTWVAITKDKTTAPDGNFTRVSGTHYAIDSASTSQPSPPTGGTLLMKVVTSSGAVSTVTDLRTLRPSKFAVSGWRYSAKTSAFTINASDNFTLFDVSVSGGAFTVTLPPAADVGAGFIIIIKKSDSSGNAVTVDGDGSETLDGSTTKTLTTQYDASQYISNGTNWAIATLSDSSKISDVVDDTSPQLGAKLDANSFSINEAKAGDVSSATTTDIGVDDGNYIDITGTTTITGLGTEDAGVERTVQFDGILTLTHNGTSLILPGAANITTAAGDHATFRSLGSGNWRCVVYTKASGAPVVGLVNVVEDTTPQLGGALDANNFSINEAKGADIASASAINLGNADGNYVEITGTTTITSISSEIAGRTRKVRFTGVLTLTHNGTSLILPTNANIVTVAGDTATFISLGSGNWLCSQYQRDDGTALQPVQLSVIQGTRATDAASGDQTISGVGFTPKAILILGGRDSFAGGVAIGISDATIDGNLADLNGQVTDTWSTVGTEVFVYFETSSLSQKATLDSFNSDGCVLSWVRNGSTAASATITFNMLFIG